MTISILGGEGVSIIMITFSMTTTPSPHPHPPIVCRSKAQKVVKKSEQEGRNADTLNYDERKPFVLCAKTLTPIYRYRHHHHPPAQFPPLFSHPPNLSILPTSIHPLSHSIFLASIYPPVTLSVLCRTSSLPY
jgi:hypothetical protein